MPWKTMQYGVGSIFRADRLKLTVGENHLRAKGESVEYRFKYELAGHSDYKFETQEEAKAAGLRSVRARLLRVLAEVEKEMGA